jgi:hypothetical protein
MKRQFHSLALALLTSVGAIATPAALAKDFDLWIVPSRFQIPGPYKSPDICYDKDTDSMAIKYESSAFISYALARGFFNGAPKEWIDQFTHARTCNLWESSVMMDNAWFKISSATALGFAPSELDTFLPMPSPAKIKIREKFDYLAQ